MAVLIKNVTTYQKTKPLYEAYRKARNKEKYRAEHERGIILHEAAAKALKAAQISGKLPSVPTLQAEYEKLQGQKEALYTDYGKLKKQVQCDSCRVPALFLYSYPRSVSLSRCGCFSACKMLSMFRLITSYSCTCFFSFP